MDFCRFRSKHSSNPECWVVQRRCGRSLSLSRSIAFSFNREFSLNQTVYLLFWWLKPYFHSRFRKTHRLSKGIENIKKTSARRFVTRRVSSRRSRSRRLDFLDDLSSIYLGDRYVFSPLSSFAWESRICGLLSPLCLVKFMFPNIPCGTYRNSGRPASLCAMFDDDRSPLHVLHFWSFCIAVNDICSPRVVLISVSCCCPNKSYAWESRISGWLVFRFPHIYNIVWYFLFEMTPPSVASCDSARTHPPFLASSRPHKNLRNEPCFFYYVKQINSKRKSSIFVPFQGGTPLDLYFLSEIRLLDF